MRANVIAVVFAAALVLSINAADTHPVTHPNGTHNGTHHNGTHHHNATHHIDVSHASHIQHHEAVHIIKKINDLREKVASGHVFKNITASNMKAIHWDHHLAASAHLAAAHYKKGNAHTSHHDTRHGTHGHHHAHAIKEITFVATSKCEHFKHAHLDKAFEIWEKGHSHLDHIHINSYAAEHSEERILSQLIWAETGHIGCGYANTEVLHGHKEFQQVIVCQFQVAGNQKGHPIFQVGKPCAHCQAGHECNTTKNAVHPSLCYNKTDVHTHLDHKWFGNNTHHNHTEHPHGNHTHPVHNHTTAKNCSAVHFDDAMKASFVKALNTERDLVASGQAAPLPTASNMHQLQWDSALELTAQKWAEQCVHAMDVQHKHHLNVSEVVFGMSANSSFSKFNENAALSALKRGRDQVNLTLVNKFAMTTKEANIYSQIIWAETTKVGCAFSNLIEEVGTGIIKKQQYIQVLVCHFSTQGDHPGQPIYTSGKTCAHCKSGVCDTTWKHLCPV